MTFFYFCSRPGAEWTVLPVATASAEMSRISRNWTICFRLRRKNQFPAETALSENANLRPLFRWTFWSDLTPLWNFQFWSSFDRAIEFFLLWPSRSHFLSFLFFGSKWDWSTWDIQRWETISRRAHSPCCSRRFPDRKAEWESTPHWRGLKSAKLCSRCLNSDSPAPQSNLLFLSTGS